MIVGNGDIASVLQDKEDFIFFASGVSNSQETRNPEFHRELALLNQQDRTKRLVYFSSLSIFYSDSKYAVHKRRMEDVIKKYSPRYCIIRLGNIDWGTNPHTLINYLRAHPETEIRDVYRYVVGKEEFLHWIDLIPPWNVEVNIPGRMLKVREIADEYCN